MCGGAFDGTSGPGCGVVDISLITDVSFSIVQAGAMDDLRGFTHNIVDAFALNSAEGAMIDITAFAEDSVSVIAMASDPASIHGAIDSNIRYGPRAGTHYSPGPGNHEDYRPSRYTWGQTGMDTDMLSALQGGADQYTNGAADRDFAPNVIIIITDAEDTEGHDVAQIVDLRNAILQAGAAGSPNGSEVIIAVGVGNKNDAVLEALATGGYVYSVNNWQQVQTLLGDIALDVCSFAEPPPNPAPSAPVDFGGMSGSDFYDAARYGGTVPSSGTVTAADDAEYELLVAGIRERMRLAQSNGCYTWAQVQPDADGWRCGPLQQAASRGGLQATSVILVPLAVDSSAPGLEGNSIEFYREESGRFAFGLFWIDAEQTFENGTAFASRARTSTARSAVVSSSTRRPSWPHPRTLRVWNLSTLTRTHPL